MELAEKANDDVVGLGRVTFRPLENEPSRMLALRGGRQTVVGHVPAKEAWQTLIGLRAARRKWFAEISPGPSGFLSIELFGIADCIDLADASFPLSPELGDPFDAAATLHRRFVRWDAWTPSSLLLIRCDLEAGRMFLRSDTDEAEVRFNEERPEVGRPGRAASPGRMPKWLVVSTRADPFDPTAGWDPLLGSQLQSHITGLGDFLAVWQTYSEAEEIWLRKLRDELGSVRYGRVRLSEAVDARRTATISINRRETAGADFLDLLALHHLEGRTLDLELGDRRPEEGSDAAVSARRGSARARRTIGRVSAVIPSTGDVRIDIDGTDLPAADGWAYLSITGDLRQIERRSEAMRRLQADEAGIPSLRSLLAGNGGRTRALAKPLRKSLPASVAHGGLTERQLEAVRIALTTPDIALIQGPPGTGKTKVITAIEESLAHLEGSERSTHLVLLTSTQNDAVDQVAARTRIFGLPPYRDGRGNINPIADWRRERLFKAHQVLDADVAHRAGTDVASTYVRLRDTPVTTDELVDELSRLTQRALGVDIDRAARALAEGLRARRLKPSARQKLERRIRSLRTSETSFNDDGPERLSDLQRLLASVRLPDIWRDEFEGRVESVMCAADGTWRMSAALRDDMLDRLAAELDDRPSRAPKEVTDLFADAVGTSNQLAQREKGALITVGEAMERYVEDIEQRPQAADEAISTYTVVHAATCQRSSQYLPAIGRGAGPARFENTIVDEAGRVSPNDLIIPLIQARQRVILVGDHRQLPAVYDDSIARGVPQSELLDQSLFERLFLQLGASAHRSGVQRTVTLDQQFRMHPKLGNFVSRVFYEPHGDKVHSPRGAEHFTHEFPGFEGRTAAWVDVPHRRGKATRSARKSWSRQCEAEVVAGIVKDLVIGCPDRSVGVIAFYGDQQDLIMELLLGELTERSDTGELAVHPDFQDFTNEDGVVTERLRIGTVDAFQGKEFDAVVLSTVRSELPSDRQPSAIFGFLTVENRFCVALSRQRRLLVVVGDRGMADLPQAESIRGLRELRDLCDEDAIDG